ncbi:MAG: four helix bundle protein [Dehalococcoidia bacterium]
MKWLPYRKLEVWRRSFALAMEVVDVAEEGPLARRFYYRDQLCDAAMSVPANIAEGNGRSTPLDYASFLDRARASLFELDTWLQGARDKGWIDPAAHDRWLSELFELSAMLNSLASKIRATGALPSRSRT